ncbi:ABC transporter substrate-binding protein [Solicola sp. PLA-1-18]|uniref:ABC transporter substrate-binding protein n=1 Tax=Solicola sp. PLA-1-18 TaxID=3380532 RepID=UPI003B821036
MRGPHPSRTVRLIAALSGVVLAATACGGGDAMGEASADEGTIVVGSANFAENELLAQMYSEALKKAGFTVETKLNIGSREILYEAMKDGSVNVLPEYNGALLSYLDAKDTSTTTETVDAALIELLPANLEVLDPSPAQDKNTVVVTEKTAEANDLESIADLAPVAPSLVFAGAPEDKDRYQGLVGLEEVYGLKFKEFKPLDQAGPLTISALADGDVGAGILYSTTPEIEERGFVALTDPENVFGVQNVIPFVNTDTVPDGAADVLDEISAKLDTTTLTELNARVQIDKDDAVTVARDWLTENGLL